MRGSLHLNALIWTEDCPKLTSETKEYYIEYIDKHVQAYCTYPTKMMTLNYMIWLTSTKNILIPKLVEKFQKSSNVDLTLANSSQIESL